MKKEFNGETWMLIILILLSICSYWYLYENKMDKDILSKNSQLEVIMQMEGEGLSNEKGNLTKSAELIDQKIIKKTIEKVKEWLPVN
jgi:hypothetical protein